MSNFDKFTNAIGKTDQVASVVHSVFKSDNVLPKVQIALDGKPIYLRNFNCSLTMERESEDMSGQKSSTERSDKGVKAKKLAVRGVIPYENAEWLTDLLNLAERVDEKGEQKSYRVANRTADAANMRECVFTGTLSIEESTVQAWDVSFELVEKNSVSEKKEQRTKKPIAKKQSETAAKSSKSVSTGTTAISTKSTATSTSTETTVEKQAEYDSALGQILG